MSVPPKVVFAAGGLLWRAETGRSPLALVHRPRHGDWALAKGKLDPGERWQDAALREVREETGFDAELGEFAGVVCYVTRALPKIVLFWNMRARGPSSFTPSEEVDQVVWLSPEEAIARLDHAGERELVADTLRGR